MKIKPVGDYVVVKQIKEEKKKGNIIIAESDGDCFSTGIVEAVSTGVYSYNGTLIPISVAVGDKVLYQKFAGVDLDDDLYLIHDNEILGVVEG